MPSDGGIDATGRQEQLFRQLAPMLRQRFDHMLQELEGRLQRQQPVMIIRHQHQRFVDHEVVVQQMQH